jgi:L-aspartate oxidase
MNIYRSDYLVIGSGLAGLAVALKIAEFSKVILLTKGLLSSTNTAMAQGGIAAVLSDEDNFDNHINDTLVAGAGLCRSDVVSDFIHQAPDRIKDLINWGVHFDGHFDGENFKIDLTREGGHSFRRILHHEDQTGKEIHQTLTQRILEHKNIQVVENHFAIDIILNKQLSPLSMGPAQCLGVYSLNKESNTVEAFLARSTILATGGAGKIYLYTSNWSGATGDGIAMAYRAGCRVANLEFMQFHPTCLYHPDARNFLISEALRGEGGELINFKGEPFMKKHHALGSLAPRDIVARSIDAEMKQSGQACVFLDMTQHSRKYLEARFPLIFNKCLEYGIDMSTKPIPVVPAAHYLCGGVLTDHKGLTDIPGLLVIGESACTGLHGANRLASNSLLECLVTAHNSAEYIKEHFQAASSPEIPTLNPPNWIDPQMTNDDELVVITHMWDEIRRLMWNYVGIVRSNKRLERAQHRLINMLSEVREYYSHFKLSSDILELRNLSIVADLSVRCARRRKESRGIHFNIDFPQTNKQAEETILFK